MRVNAIQRTDENMIADRTNTANTTEEFSSYLQTTASLEEIFTEAAEKYNVPKNLIKAIAKTESEFRPDVTSKAGAMGVMQLMPGTAKEMGVTDAYDPYQNIMGGTKLISQLLEKYDGDVTLALAAYNAGCGNVKKYGGVPPFQETQNYVVKVQNYMNGNIQIPEEYYTRTGMPQGAGQRQGVAAASVEEAESHYYNDLMEKLFSYDDYLRFIDIYMKLQAAEREKEQEQQEEKMQQSDSFYSYQEIKYNPAVLGIINRNL